MWFLRTVPSGRLQSIPAINRSPEVTKTKEWIFIFYDSMKTEISPCQIQDTTKVKFAFSISIWKYSYEFTHWRFRSRKTNRTRWNNSKRSYPWHCCPSLSMVNHNKSKIPFYHDAILFMSKVNHSQRKPVFKLVRFWKLPLFPISNRKTCSTWERIWPT